MKRYCQTLELVDDPQMIEQYCEAHANVWPEIIEGQRSVGIVSMEIYRLGRQLFMICDTVDDFDWNKDMSRLASMPRQAEWEAYVSSMQGCLANLPSTSKWHLMTRVFDSEKRSAPADNAELLQKKV